MSATALGKLLLGVRSVSRHARFEKKFAAILRSSVLAVMAWFALAAHSAAQTSPALRPVSLTSPDTSRAIVVGFLGGRVRRDNTHHAEVQLAERLRAAFPSSVEVHTFENRRYEEAHQAILHLLDSNGDGALSSQEKRNARIILYGHSWGAWAVVALSRALEHDGIPVLLTVQVDSIPRKGQDDSVIPANVLKAVNFYQPHGLLHGQPVITAADPAHTEILGNFRFDYSNDQISCPGYPWWNTYLAKAHTEIECDPRVWSQIENVIRAELPPSGSASNVLAGGAQ